jgi:hypothetical protein
MTRRCGGKRLQRLGATGSGSAIFAAALFDPPLFARTLHRLALLQLLQPALHLGEALLDPLRGFGLVLHGLVAQGVQHSFGPGASGGAAALLAKGGVFSFELGDPLAGLAKLVDLRTTSLLLHFQHATEEFAAALVAFNICG